MTTKLTVSAPGKILLAGGYLVLESPNVGVVISVDKRFYTSIEIEKENYVRNVLINVKSPQFDQEWTYSFDKESFRLVSDDRNTCRNEFVEKTLRVSLLYLLSKTKNKTVSRISLSIKADNDFYSLVPHLQQRNWPCTLPNAKRLPKFLPAAKDPKSNKIFKTGLGSSACLVTSLVGALCHSLGEPELIFQLAQISHCHAQGKVGSGFDVSAACHGSHVYRRFPKEVLSELLVLLDDDDDTVAESSMIETALSAVVESSWDGGVVAPLHLKTLLQVSMADVSGGSESPSMARTVLNWKKAQEPKRCIPHWSELVSLNQRIVDLLQKIASLPSFSDKERKTLIETSSDSWKDTTSFNSTNLSRAATLLSELKQSCVESRRHLKEMGEAAGVPIEPDEQTMLANATQNVAGVVAALVPGAGGYDALACLYINDDNVLENIGNMWASWEAATVCPLTVQAGQYGDGIQKEEIM